MGERPVIGALAERFPQLYLAPAEGVSQSEGYRAIVRRGERFRGSLGHFTGSPEDSFTIEHTPAGNAEILFLKNRGDFERCVQIMAHRCEPVAIPATMGASCISGINDWSKIHAHLAEYRENGGTDEDGEFARFTAVKENYKTVLIILSDGPYSGLPPHKTPYGEEEWLRLSREIRKYHELTHFVCKRLYPEKKYPLWDELLADHMGLLFAAGEYDRALALRFLGIENEAYRGGRLENYAAPDEDTVKWVLDTTAALAARSKALRETGLSGFALTSALEEQAEGLGACR